MKRLLLLALAALLIPAQASAVEVSPEKQAMMNARGWTVGGEMTVTPVPAEAAGNRGCKRVKARTAVRDENQSPMAQDWASVSGCITQNCQVRIVGVGHGQGSSGDHWKRVSPWGQPWIEWHWVDPNSARSTTEVVFRYANGQANNWNLRANAKITKLGKGTARCGDDELRGKREGSIV